MNYKKIVSLMFFPILVLAQEPTSSPESTKVSDAEASVAAPKDYTGRVASIYLSENIINEQLQARVKSETVKEIKIVLDADKDQIFLRGKVQIPTEELKAVNLDPRYGAYDFQLTVKPETNKEGYLILEFPLSQTYFYPSNSKNPEEDRVVIPVQMLSLALASVRGYLSALSGDFSSFDRRNAKLAAQIKELRHQAKIERDPDAKETFELEIETLKLQQAAVPLERRHLEKLSKKMSNLLAFTGEKELNLNNEFGARRNALIFKIKISKLVPYLSGVELGGVKIHHANQDGGKVPYLGIYITSHLTEPYEHRKVKPAPRPPMKIPPGVIVRLNQSLFDSTALAEIEKQKTNDKLKDLDIQFQEDGMHATGGWKSFLFTIPFDAAIDFVADTQDSFEVRVRKMSVIGINLSFLTHTVLDMVKKKLDTALNGICNFEYIEKTSKRPEAIRVSINPKNLLPAFPDLHLIDVDVRDHEFLLKLGRPQD